MKKLINFRPFFILFLISICSIYASVKLNKTLLYCFLFILPIIFIVYLIIKKKYVFLGISLVVIIFVSFYSYFYAKNFTENYICSKYYVVYATVTKINKVDDDFYYLTISNAIGVGEGGTETNFNGSISLGVKDSEHALSIKLEDKILFQTYLTSTSFFDNNWEVNSFYVKNNIRYLSENINYSKLTVYNGNPNLLQRIKQQNKTTLLEIFGEDEGELAFAILYGDKSTVPKNLLNVFKYSGVVHLFSVSGLHVSLIVFIIYYILKRLKTKNLTNFIVCSVFLFCFCFVCSFTPSVVRASIMALTLLLSKLVFRKNDTLNSLSFSGVILLVVNPLTLFDGGFQMSYLAVFGLLSLSSLFLKINIKNKFLKRVFVLVATTLGVEITLMPIMAKFYSILPTWSLISNLISIPLFSIFYPILFVTNIIASMFPFVEFILYLPKVLLNILVQINTLINLLPYSIIHVKRFGLIFSCTFWFAEFFASKYNLMNSKYKYYIATGLVVLSVILRYVLNLQF